VKQAVAKIAGGDDGVERCGVPAYGKYRWTECGLRLGFESVEMNIQFFFDLPERLRENDIQMVTGIGSEDGLFAVVKIPLQGKKAFLPMPLAFPLDGPVQ